MQAYRRDLFHTNDFARLLLLRLILIEGEQIIIKHEIALVPSTEHLLRLLLEDEALLLDADFLLSGRHFGFLTIVIFI